MVSPPRPAQMQSLQNIGTGIHSAAVHLLGGSSPWHHRIYKVPNLYWQKNLKWLDVVKALRWLEDIGTVYKRAKIIPKSKSNCGSNGRKSGVFVGGNVFETVELLRFCSFRLLTFDFDVIRISCITGQDSNKSAWEWTGWSTLHAQGMCSVDSVLCWIG